MCDPQFAVTGMTGGGLAMGAPTGDRSYYECRDNGIRAIHRVLPERVPLRHQGGEKGLAADEVVQAGDGMGQCQSIHQVVPKTDLLLLAGLLQTGEGIPTSPSCCGSGTARDFSFDDILANIPFTEVIVQWNVRPFQHQQQFPLILRQTLERLIEGLERGFGLAQRVEACRDRLLCLCSRGLPVLLEVRIQ